MKNKIIFVILIILIIIGTNSVFATEWDLSAEKETYIEIADYYNSGYTTPFDSYVKSAYMQPAFIESLFSTAEQKLNETSRLRENAPYCVIKFQTTTTDGANEIRMYFCSDIQISTNVLKYVTYNTFYLKYFYKNGLLTYDNLYSWSSGTTTFTDLVHISGYSSGGIEGFLLSNFSGLQWSSSYDPYASKTMWTETYIAEKLLQFNPTLNYNNNLLLNIDVIKGDDITYDYDFFYYDENENRISVKDKISYKSSSLWYGDLYGFYISNNAISQFPNNTDFYMYIKYRPTVSSSYTISENTMLAFKTLSSITSPDAGGDTGGGGGSEGGGDTGGGSTVDLGNIENSLGEINTTIIEVGTQTNQNLDEIEQAIKDVNESITSEPVYDEDGNLAEEQPGLIGKLLQGFWNILVKFFDWLMVPDEEQISDVVDDVLENDLISESVLGLPLQLISRFLNLFEDRTYTDWVIEWDDINFTFSEKDGSEVDMKMFSAYSFNISEFVRNDETLSKMYSYYIILVNFGAVCGLIYWGAGLVKGLLGIEDSMPGANDETDSPDVTSMPDNPARRTSEKPVEKDYEALERYMQNNYNDWTHSQKSINRNYKSVGRYRSIMSDMKAGRYKKK